MVKWFVGHRRNKSVAGYQLRLADDGEESIKNVIGDLTGDIELTMYRGVIIIKTGPDNKKYKITCIAKSSTNIYLRI